MYENWVHMRILLMYLAHLFSPSVVCFLFVFDSYHSTHDSYQVLAVSGLFISVTSHIRKLTLVCFRKRFDGGGRGFAERAGILPGNGFIAGLCDVILSGTNLFVFLLRLSQTFPSFIFSLLFFSLVNSSFKISHRILDLLTLLSQALVR